MKKKTIKTRTSLYILMIIAIMLSSITLYFTLFRWVTKAVYEKEEQNVDIFVNQIEGTLDLICNSVNTDLSKFVENQYVQKFFLEAEGYRSSNYNNVREEIMNTIAFNSYNSFIAVSLYSDTQCLYPEKGKDISKILTNEEIKMVEKYNGNTVWLHKDEKKGQFVVGKRVLLSSASFKPYGYIIAYINSNILDFIERDFASLREAEIVLSNEFGEIAVKESENRKEVMDNAIIFEEKLNDSGFIISFYIPKKILFKSVMDMQKIMVNAILIAAVIFLIISYLMSVYIEYPFKDLMEMMKGSEGKLSINNKKYFNYEANKFNEFYNDLVKKNRKLIHDIYEKDIQMLQTQLEMLQTQINPHFLYNTLESVYLSLEVKGEKESANIVYMLSKLFKYALKERNTISLNKEVEMVKMYLEIEKYRFGKRLAWEITLDQAAKDITIPKLLLQPLVENAVKHGIELSKEGGMIDISITTYEETLVIVVNDDGIGISPEKIIEIGESLNKKENIQKKIRSSIGLKNVYERLIYYYGENAKLDIESADGEYTEVTVIIPDYRSLS